MTELKITEVSIHKMEVSRPYNEKIKLTLDIDISVSGYWDIDLVKDSIRYYLIHANINPIKKKPNQSIVNQIARLYNFSDDIINEAYDISQSWDIVIKALDYLLAPGRVLEPSEFISLVHGFAKERV